MSGVDEKLIVRLVISSMHDMTPDERMEIMDQFSDVFCIYCGCMQPVHGFCQCMNDE